MKEYFKITVSRDTYGEYVYFLKDEYNKIDRVFDQRFAENKSPGRKGNGKEYEATKDDLDGKILKFKNIIQEIEEKEKPKEPTQEQEKQLQKLFGLTLGNAYLRLAQCVGEKFEDNRLYNQKAAAYLEGTITDYSISAPEDEIDLLLLLNKGKYFRNTARIGNNSVYEKSLQIFEEVIYYANNIAGNENRKTENDFLKAIEHIKLDALINIGRAKRYAYDFDGAMNIFFTVINQLKPVFDKPNTKSEELDKLVSNLKLENKYTPENIYGIKKEHTKAYFTDYLLQALIHMGIIYRKRRDYTTAEKIFNLVNAIDGDSTQKNIDAQNNLGVCYRKMPEKQLEVEKTLKESIERKNKFAIINIYKYHLTRIDEKYQKSFQELKKLCKKSEDIQLRFVLGLYYEKEKEYKKAKEIFEFVYHAHPFLTRGSVGLKAYYHLAQCNILERNYTQARKILEDIRNSQEKLSKIEETNKTKEGGGTEIKSEESAAQSNAPSKEKIKYKDIMTEIDFGWCLMHEGKYEKALDLYKKILENKTEYFIEKKDLMKIYNNLAECYIHESQRQQGDQAKKTEQEGKARDNLKKVFALEEENRRAKYLEAKLELHKLIDSENNLDQNTNSLDLCKKIYDAFTELANRRPAKDIEIAGWLISAVLLYFKYKEVPSDDDLEDARSVKEVILKKLNYLTTEITMKCYFHLARFIENCLSENSDDDKQLQEIAYRYFCHVKLTDADENHAFVRLMENADFRCLKRKDRAEFLTYLVRLYENIYMIKKHCCQTTEKINGKLPVHYTTIKTLKILLKHTDNKNENPPRLRLWNTSYMNDTFEGGVFGKLLLKAYDSLEDSETRDTENKSNYKDSLEKYYCGDINAGSPADSTVYIISFSSDINSFQMWNIYGDSQKGCAIRFNQDFFDTGSRYDDPIEDHEANTYSLYEVQYCNPSDDNISHMEYIKNIVGYIKKIEEKIRRLSSTEGESNITIHGLAEIRKFVNERLNEVRFLFKNPTFQYEKESRLIRSSYLPMIDETTSDIPKLYIEVERDINGLEIILGEKQDRQTMKDLMLWLNHTGRVSKIEEGKTSDF